jgi:hypothetical protein
MRKCHLNSTSLVPIIRYWVKGEIKEVKVAIFQRDIASRDNVLITPDLITTSEYQILFSIMEPKNYL